MSALGQKRTCALQNVMSALPPIATSIAFFGMSALGESERYIQLRLPTRVSISLRSSPKSIGFVKSASAPPCKALRLVSASP
jgi:hypothetical protein